MWGIGTTEGDDLLGGEGGGMVGVETKEGGGAVMDDLIPIRKKSDPPAAEGNGRGEDFGEIFARLDGHDKQIDKLDGLLENIRESVSELRADMRLHAWKIGAIIAGLLLVMQIIAKNLKIIE